jgi:hypothetical protein
MLVFFAFVIVFTVSTVSLRGDATYAPPAVTRAFTLALSAYYTVERFRSLLLDIEMDSECSPSLDREWLTHFQTVGPSRTSSRLMTCVSQADLRSP